MIQIADKSSCCGCTACYSVCPAKCIQMKRDEEGFEYPVVSNSDCINCHRCENVCPIMNSILPNNNPQVYAAINASDEIRMQSSSGGIFPLLAQEIINNGGVVFGVAFDEQFNVKHIEVGKLENINKLQGSKYVQSDLGNTYAKVRAYLENGRLVYFSGTPCQVEGLKHTLGKEYDNLYTQDIICMGVPSPGLWDVYRENVGEIHRFSFRDKSNGWENYSVRKNEEIIPRNENAYIKAYNSRLNIRPSCYACHFKCKNRNSDITLGDFWGIDSVLPEMNDKKGTSLVILNTSKGHELFESISPKLKSSEVDFDSAIMKNPMMLASVSKPDGRDSFFQDANMMTFDKLIKKHCKTNLIARVKHNIKLLSK